MSADPVDLRRVHWFEGLFLTPGHFQRQDRFAESLAVWNARYTSSLFGIIGAGPRIAGDPTEAFAPSRLTALRLDTAVAVSVEGVRGITPGGAWIDLNAVLREEVPTLDPDTEAIVYVVRRRTPEGFAVRALDEAGGGDRLELADAQYSLTTRPNADDTAWALAVGRLRRRGDIVERDDSFIPACAFVASHSAFAQQAAELRSRVEHLHNGFIDAHNRLREIAALARRAGVTVSDDYDDMLVACREISDNIGHCAHTLAGFGVAVHVAAEALARLADSAERTMRVTPSLNDYIKRTEVAAPWAEIRQRLLEPLRPEENLADRVAAGRQLVSAFDGVRVLVDERCQDYRLVRRHRELELAIDRQTTPKTLYLRASGTVAGEAVSSDIRFRLTNLSLSPDRKYIAILFGSGDEPLGDREYAASVYVNDKVQRPDLSGAARQLAGQSNLAVPVDPHGESIRDITLTVLGGGPFGNAALFVKADARTTRFVVADSPEVANLDAPEYVTLQLTGYKSDREKKVAMIGSKQVRVRMFYDRPENKGGKGQRRMFEVIMTKGQVWSLSLSESDRNDARIVCRWNDQDSMSGMRPIYDFPELPKSLQIGIVDVGKTPTWFLRCRMKYLNELRNGTLDESVAARLEEVSTAWPAS